jgi:hypothetical protein
MVVFGIEVFEHEYYNLTLMRKAPATILDLEANFGLAALDFARIFPNEPHKPMTFYDRSMAGIAVMRGPGHPAGKVGGDPPRLSRGVDGGYRPP